MKEYSTTLREEADVIDRELDRSMDVTATDTEIVVIQELDWNQVPFNKYEYPEENLQRRFELRKTRNWKIDIYEPNIRTQKCEIAFSDSFIHDKRAEALNALLQYARVRKRQPHLSNNSITTKQRFEGLKTKSKSSLSDCIEKVKDTF